MIERKFETLLTQYGQAMLKLATCPAADRDRIAAKAVKAKAILRSFLKDILETPARATADRDSADAKRYRWLKSKKEDFDNMAGASYHATKLSNILKRQDDWDAAIDAQIESQSGKGES